MSQAAHVFVRTGARVSPRGAHVKLEPRVVFPVEDRVDQAGHVACSWCQWLNIISGSLHD